MSWQAPREPQRDEIIYTLDLLDEITGQVVHVKSVLSVDRRTQLYEVIDNFNQIRVVSRCPDGWQEVPIPA